MKYRIEKDSLGELRVPEDRLYGAQTQRAIENFPISDLKLPQSFIRALALIKKTAAQVNRDLGLLENVMCDAICQAADRVIAEEYSEHFPVDVFQTGSGTSSNMNINEVLAHIASQASSLNINPNDHVNLGQSSNDVIPTAIHLSTSLEIHQKLLPALKHLKTTIEEKGTSLKNYVKTGRTHLMDAMPITLQQELSGWSKQIQHGIERLESSLPRLQKLAQGGTAVGTGINAHPEFAKRFNVALSATTGINFIPNDNFFEALSAQDTAVEVSGQLKTIAVSFMKIANDLRWMNSGPLSGLTEIALPALQPGSSIMPGKVNPVISESVMMVAAQVMGNDTTITISGQAGNFQLNVMLPIIAYNLLQSIALLSSSSRNLANKAILGFVLNQESLESSLAKNPILVTALNPIIGYLKAASIAKKAYAENLPVIDVAEKETELSRSELETLLNPQKLTQGGIN